MKNYCTYSPKKAADTFFKLQRDLDYNLAWNVWALAASDEFKNKYKDSISLDKDGIPTYESIKNNPFIKSYINKTISRDNLQKNFREMNDTLANYNIAIHDATNFNKSNVGNNRFIATVERTNDGKIKVIVSDRNDITQNKAYEQAATHSLNQRLSNILSPIGVDYDILSEEEVAAGRIGVTNFNAAKNIATSSASLIRVANNMEGAEALSEEFSHVLVRALNNNSLMQRVRNILNNNDNIVRAILGDDYDDVYNFNDGDNDLIVEEALGQLLRDNLISNEKNEIASQAVIGRLLNYIKNKFKHISLSEISEALIEAETIMDDLAKQILNPTSEVNKSILEMKKSDLEMDAQFNALSKRLERNLDFLKTAAKLEMKKYKITSSEEKVDNSLKKEDVTKKRKERAKQTKENIEYYQSFDENSSEIETAKAITTYAYEALNELKGQMINLGSITGARAEKTFEILRSVRMTIQYYGNTIRKLNDLYTTEEDTEDNMFAQKFEINTASGTEEVNMEDTIKDLNNILTRLVTRFSKTAIPMFAKFLEQYISKDILDLLSKQAGRKVTIEEIITSAESDISFFDYFFDAMADSSSILLQIFDKVVKKAKNEARLNAISDIKQMQALQQEAEKRGINSYEWMFERYDNGNKTGNIISEINYAQFEKDMNDFLDEIDREYGKNPTDAIKINLKKEAKIQWAKEHCDNYSVKTLIETYGFNTRTLKPLSSLYANQDYYKLSEDQKYILDRYLDLKHSLDVLYPADKASTFKAVQMRKDGVQRFIDIAKSPSTILSNIKENLKSEFIRQEDDNAEFGSAKTGITDFDGREFMVLPALYTTRLKNPDDLSTDVFGSLMAYAAAAREYDSMSNVIDALEIGRSLVLDNLQVRETRGDNKLVERLTALGTTVENKIFKSKGASRIEQRLNDLFNSNIYHRYLKDQGEIAGVDINKATTQLIRLSSMAQLGFNYLANIANITNGICMTNIEAAAGEWFNAKELFNADKIYLGEIHTIASEANSRTPKSKVNLFAELFNVRHGFDKVKYSSQRNSVLARLFGKSIAFLGQEGGDHWLYNRVAISMALHTTVRVPGEGAMNLWEAVRTRNVDDSDVMEAYLPEGTTYEDGTEFDIGDWSEKMAAVNRQLFGVYNDEDRSVANGLWYGRLMLLYRKWIKPQFNKRFQKEQVNMSTGQAQEGFYRTVGKLLGEVARELKRGEFQLAAYWGELSDSEKKNVVRALTEISQVLLLWGLTQLSWGGDDKKRPWRMKFLRYMIQRTYHETAVFVPSGTMWEEGVKTLKSPTPVIGMCSSMYNMINSMFTPSDWTQEIESGQFKGHSKLWRNIYKAPIPGVMQYRMINRFTGDLDPLTNYLARPYVGF